MGQLLQIQRSVSRNAGVTAARTLAHLTLFAALVLVVVSGCTPPEANRGDSSPPAEPPWFEDVTDKVGLRFTHDAGPINSEYFMPQITGSGCAFLDFDGDGRLDIYLIHNGGPDGARNQLFRQQADSTFKDVSAACGLDVAGYGMGVAVGDLNNDGQPDAVLTEFGATRIFLNQGNGRFREVTQDTGVDNPLWATSAALFDYDRDGWLDLFVANYVDYDRSHQCRGGGGKPDFCGPKAFLGTVDRLYRNLGAGKGAAGVRFEDVTAKAGLNTTVTGKGLGVLCADFNGDGWPDIFVANDLTPNHLWINQRDGTFKEQAMLRGVAYTGSGNPAANMGIAWGDVDGDGLPDLFVTHLIDETHTLWKQKPLGFFHDATAAAGLSAGERSTGWGTALVDFDCDGWLDLAFVNGGVVRNRAAAPSGPFWRQYAQRNQLFANAGHGKFRDISAFNPDLCGVPRCARGMAVGDFDNDGAPDLLISEAGGKARLLRNCAAGKGHWLSVRAILPAKKRDAYGAEVTVWAGGKAYRRLLHPAYSYGSSNDPRGHFGLGPEARYDSIDVLWPDGSAETFAGGPADRQITLRQGEGKTNPKGQRK